MSLGGIGGLAFPPGSTEILALADPGTTITGAGFQTLCSFTLEGGLLGSGNLLFILGLYEFTTGGGSLLVGIDYGGTSVQSGSAAVGPNRDRVNGIIAAADSESAQDIWVHQESGGANGGIGAGAVDSSVDQTASLQISLSTPTDVVVGRRFMAILYRAP